MSAWGLSGAIFLIFPIAELAARKRLFQAALEPIRRPRTHATGHGVELIVSTVFTKNRGRLLEGDVAQAFFDAVSKQARQRRMASSFRDARRLPQHRGERHS